MKLEDKIYSAADKAMGTAQEAEKDFVGEDAPAPGYYSAPGDPYVYHVMPDGRIFTIHAEKGVQEAAAGTGANKAIVGQIASGQLEATPIVKAETDVAPEDEPQIETTADMVETEEAGPEDGPQIATTPDMVETEEVAAEEPAVADVDETEEDGGILGKIRATASKMFSKSKKGDEDEDEDEEGDEKDAEVAKKDATEEEEAA